MTSRYATQLIIPKDFPALVKEFTREVLRHQPEDIYEFGAKYFAGEIAPPSSKAAASSSAARPKANDPRVPFSRKQIDALRHKTRFDEFELNDVVDQFREVAVDGTVDRDGFYKVLRPIADANFNLFEGIYRFFDRNGDGILNMDEFVVGMSILFRGAPEEKLKLSFQTFDTNGNGSISRAELKRALKFQLSWGMQLIMMLVSSLSEDEFRSIMGSSKAEYNASVRTLADGEAAAEHWTQDIFTRYDKDRNQSITFEEFKAWATEDPTIGDILLGLDVSAVIPGGVPKRRHDR